MNTRLKRTVWVAIPFIIIAYTSGCKEIPPSGSATGTTTPPIAAAPVQSPVAPDAPKLGPSVPPAAVIEGTAPAGADKVSLASADVHPAPEKETVKPAEPSTPAPAKKKIEVKEYTPETPSLMGLSLKTKADAVNAKFGNPKDQYTMDEDSDPVTVLDYTDFLVGFDKQNELIFVDVRSTEVNPGLNGLKLGQSVNDAYTALGKPNTNTSYVLTYKSNGSVLKLDIDPKTEQVNSIKLFAGK